MSFISINEIDRLIYEDVPYIDLTSWSLGIKEQQGQITYFTREDATVCGTEEVRAIFDRLRIETRSIVLSGQKVSAGAELISGTGRAQDLHIAWKVGQNILDSCSGIATKTRRMVDVADEIIAMVDGAIIIRGAKESVLPELLHCENPEDCMNCHDILEAEIV